jgi:hypothetical protein
MAYQFQAQDVSEPFSDVDVEMLGNQQTYHVASGLGVTYSASDLTATIAAGVAVINGVNVTVAGGAVTLVPDPTNPLWAWIGVDDAGAVQIDHGTAAATPAKGELSNVDLPLALVKVDAGLTVANSASVKIVKSIPTLARTWEHIDTQVLSGTAASVSFPSLSTDYKVFRLTADIFTTASLAVWIRLNNDSGGNYDYHSVAAGAGGATTNAAAQLVIIGAAGAASRNHVSAVIAKQVAADQATGHAVGTYLTGAFAMTLTDTTLGWRNTADLISRIDLVASTSTFAANTRVTLEGMKVAT